MWGPEVLPLEFTPSEQSKSARNLSSILENSRLSPAAASERSSTREVEQLRQTLDEQRAIIEEQNAEIRHLRQLYESRRRKRS
jgi:hypothetical protein